MLASPSLQRYEVVIEIGPGHPNYPAETSLRKPTALSQLQVIEADLRGSPLRCEYIGADNVLSLETMETSRESTPFDFFRAAVDGADSSSSPEALMVTSPFRIKQEMEPSLLRYMTSQEQVSESQGTSPEKELSRIDEEVRFVRRSMLEVPKKRRWRPAIFSLSVRVPGSLQREIVHMEEVPVLCRRLKIVHGEFRRMIELPQIMLTARRRSYSVPLKQELVLPLDTKSGLTIGDSMLDPALMDSAMIIPEAEPMTDDIHLPGFVCSGKEHHTTLPAEHVMMSKTTSKMSRKKRTYYKYPWWRLTKRLRLDLPGMPCPTKEYFTILS